MNSQPLDFSILIVSWNTQKMLSECLTSIYEHLAAPLRFETIVVDNASTDGTMQTVPQQFSQVMFIKNDENIGFANAVNMAAAEASGKYLLLFNSDARFLDNSFKDLLDVLEQDETVGIVTGEMLSTGHRYVESCFGFPSFFELLRDFSVDLIYKIGKGSRGSKRCEVTTVQGITGHEVDWASGAYLFVRRELMMGANILDERIFMYFEDTLLCRHAWQKGYRVLCLDTAPIFHEGGGSSRKVNNVKAVYGYRSSRTYIEELYGAKGLWWYERLIRLTWYSLLPPLLILGLVGFGGIGSLAKKKQSIVRDLLSIPSLTSASGLWPH